MSTSITPTPVTVRVIAKDGKFIGDDVGGCSITIEQISTGQILATGHTTGDSGANGSGGVMCVSMKRGVPIPTTSTSAQFSCLLDLKSPAQLRFTAKGPLGGVNGWTKFSANTVSQTTWVSPGMPLTEGNGVLLEMPGLICQFVKGPSDSTVPQEVSVMVAMMCGCPISTKKPNQICPCSAADQPWLPEEFVVTGTITSHVGGDVYPVSFVFNSNNQNGLFIGTINNLPLVTYDFTVVAYQSSTGNTGSATVATSLYLGD